jgi:hypothetical protein
MRRTRTPVLVGCFAALVLTAPRPAAAAISATPAIHYDKADGALVQQVRGKWERKSAYDLYQRYGTHACYAGYLPFGFRPSVYYGCPGYGWPSWRPPEAAPRPENFRQE